MRSGSHVQLAALRNRDLDLQTTLPSSNHGTVERSTAYFRHKNVLQKTTIVWNLRRGSFGLQDHRICPFVKFFFLWGYLKNRVYTTRPRTLDELKQRIQEEIRGIPAEMLHRAMGNLKGRLNECIRGGGRHLQDVIFRH